MNNLKQLADTVMPKKDKIHMVRISQSKMIKYNQITLKEELEKYDFEQLANNTMEQEEKRRFLALSYLKNGKNIQQVANALKVSYSSVYAWIRQFNKDNLEGIKKADRRKPHLEIYYSKKEELQQHDFEQLAKSATYENEKKHLLALACLKQGKSVVEISETLKMSQSIIYIFN